MGLLCDSSSVSVGGRYYYLRFRDEDTEVQRSEVISNSEGQVSLILKLCSTYARLSSTGQNHNVDTGEARHRDGASGSGIKIRGSEIKYSKRSTHAGAGKPSYSPLGLQRRKTKLRKVKRPAQGHTAKAEPWEGI